MPDIKIDDNCLFELERRLNVFLNSNKLEQLGNRHAKKLFLAEIVEVEIGGVAIYRPFGEFRRAKSYCHLYGAQGQRQAYF
ncbi:hypothetical protein TNCV_1849111 [Trichonephila clavipes]|nr:hypothetical protein TNCV_1849111 [Trichonephila clavipes]